MMFGSPIVTNATDSPATRNSTIAAAARWDRARASLPPGSESGAIEKTSRSIRTSGTTVLTTDSALPGWSSPVVGATTRSTDSSVLTA